MKQWAPMQTSASMRAPLSITANGPMLALASTCASSATTALGWIPATALGLGSNKWEIRAYAWYGSATIRALPAKLSASAALSNTAPAWQLSRYLRYCGLARKLN
ncbi:hypothetical protein D3C79_892720 [compost metagenome]